MRQGGREDGEQGGGAEVRQEVSDDVHRGQCSGRRVTPSDYDLSPGKCQDQGGSPRCLRGVGGEDHPDPRAVGGPGQAGHQAGSGRQPGGPGGVRGLLQHVVRPAALQCCRVSCEHSDITSYM